MKKDRRKPTTKKKKGVVLIEANGNLRPLPEMISLGEMQKLVGGYIEQVKVLDRTEPNGERVYSYMYVNDEGLLDGLPRNEKATEIYQRNVRTAYPGEENPFLVANREFIKEAKARGFTELQAMVSPSYDADPYIAGPAIYYEGYTCEEVLAVMNAQAA